MCAWEDSRMRVSSKRQVTIPKPLHEAFALLPHTAVTFRVQDGRVIIDKAEGSTRGTTIVAPMHGRTTTNFTTDERMKMIRGDDA